MTHETELHPETIPALIEQHQESLQLSDKAVAEALGYTNPSVIGLIKTGQFRLPMDKVFPLAEALDLEPGYIMRVLLRHTNPIMLKSIEDCMGPLSLSLTEKRLIAALRVAADGREVSPIFMDGAPIIAMIVG